MRLLFASKLLTDDSITLRELDIFGETCVMCVSKPRAAGAPRPRVDPVAVPPAVPVLGAEEEKLPAAGGANVVPVKEATQAVPPVGGGAAKEGGGAAARQAAEAGAAPAQHEEMIAMSLKTLRGTSTHLEVPAHATFGHIKHK